jgi:hypothetical protein
VNKSLKHRVGKLQALFGPADRRPSDVLCLDLDGKILWDGSEAMREWAGRPLTDWPREWWELPWSIKLLQGIDPLPVLGLDLKGMAQPFAARLDEHDPAPPPAPNSPRLHNPIEE